MPDLKKFQANEKTPLKSRNNNNKKPFPIFLLDGVAMAAGFFVGANYPAVGQSIVATGSVASGSSRMKQTMQYVDDMVNVNDFEQFGKAVQSNAKVRLAHAIARKQIERSGLWDREYYGEIISDFDTMIFLSGITLQKDLLKDAELSERAIESMRIQAKAMQYLLGAPKEIVTMQLQDNKRFFVIVVAHLDDSPETARKVVQAFRDNEYFRPTKTLKEKLSREMAFLTANLVTRVSWGNVMADSIGLDKKMFGLPLESIANVMSEPPQALMKLIPMLIGFNKKLNKLRKAIPNFRSRDESAYQEKSPEVSLSPYKGSYGVFKSKS